MSKKKSDKASGPQVDDARHPEDVEMEREGKEYAAANIDTWFERHKEELKQTIATYADGDAEELWWILRERFWTREP